MPEAPEVETARRTMERVLLGHRIVEVEIPEDDIVLCGLPATLIEEALLGSTVTEVGRIGKYWWLGLDREPWLMGHLGMAGWIRELGAPTIRLREHGQAPMDDETGRPRFLKMLLGTEEGQRIAFTDGRRLGRLWLGDPAGDPRFRALGPDVYRALPSTKEIASMLAKRKAPIKALLLDQALFAGVGNWIADEALYHARISPKRLGADLTKAELERLRKALANVVEIAVAVGADSGRYPPDWLFHHRWGGGKGVELVQGRRIVREPVGGRTTAWVPEVQR
ncbi:MAG TPA: DNA-formamidopyrimidine glycosylase family protein [Fimbriimonadaceae bacterium]|nr:DNA-formamidopyrimidine glycosylase family protein [Fimbriimonadaceae bacterium]HRJ97377.1 DNA-formamidopyrimidine glycosylase family protein [Fimbriimonadaceae bacterium]